MAERRSVKKGLIVSPASGPSRVGRAMTTAAILWLPALLVALGTGAWVLQRDDARHRDSALALATAVAGQIDLALEQYRTAVQVLARSHALVAAGDLTTFHAEAAQVSELLDGWVVLARDGPQLDVVMTTLLPPGAAMPLPEPRETSYPEVAEAEARSRVSGRAVVSDAFVGRVTGTPVVTVATPAEGPLGSEFYLYLSFDTQRLSRLLARTELPAGHVARIVDGRGRIVGGSGIGADGRLDPAPSWIVEAMRERDGWIGAPSTPGGSAGSLGVVVRLRSAPGWAAVVTGPDLPRPLGAAILLAPATAATVTFLISFAVLRAIRRTRWLARQAEAERRRAEELEVALGAARDAEAAKSHLLGVLAHEVRTPLAGILGALERLGDGRDPAGATETAQLAQRVGAGLLRLVDDTLEMAQLGAGRLKLSQARFNPGQLLRDVAGLVSTEAAAHGNRIEIQAPDPCPDLVGDDFRIRRVLLNLAANAVKFTRQGEVRISVVLSPGDDGALRTVFTVSDTGVGIAPEDMADLFKDFGKLERTQEMSPHGAGLGLAICGRLAARMGGVISVESRLGEGSTFRFELQLPRAPEAAEDGAAIAGTPGTLRGLKVLLVEDDELLRDVESERLRMAGASVDTAADAREAVEKADAQAFELVLMDIGLPGGGLVAAERMRSGGGPSGRAAILALTGMELDGMGARLAASGLDGVLRKPLDLSALRDRLDALRGRRLAPRAGSAARENA